MNMERKILIIEDDADTAAAMRVVLEAHNYEVLTEIDPVAGLEAAQKELPNVIVLDVMFGKGEQTKGFDYAVKFKQDPILAPIPILMITAVNIKHPDFSFSPKSDGEYLPVDDFIDKPAQPEDLVQKVEKLLGLEKSAWSNWPEKDG